MFSSSSVTYAVTPSEQSPKLRTQQYIPTPSSQRKQFGQKRVEFEGKGFTFTSVPLTTALRMAEKHETNPSTTRRRQYRKTIDLRSASGWTKWNLDLFNIKFEKNKYTNLRDYLGADTYRMDSELDDGKANQERG